jgi:hypothetical protein
MSGGIMIKELPKRQMSAQDKRWEAESDARTIAEASAIKADPKRLAAAAAAAREMGEKKMVEAKAIMGLARMRKKR